MIFEWDEHKREINRRKHQLDLIDGQYLFDGRPVVTYLRRVVVKYASSQSVWSARNSTPLCGRSGAVPQG
jgi:uncharacterized DUF497 family protein